MNIEIIRDDETPMSRNYGKLFVEGKYFCETLEDQDRYLENDGVKVDGDTAIPRGRYRVTRTMSQRFGRVIPLVNDVPGFTGVRLHGGNTEADTHGCPLLGAVRNSTGIANCKGVNDRLDNAIEAALNAGDEVWLEVS